MAENRREFKRGSRKEGGSDSVREFQRSDSSRSSSRRSGSGRSDSGRSDSRRSDSRRPDSRGPRGNSRNSDRREKIEMFSVVCDDCGKNCEVPFKPSSSKPVYCNDCFKKTDGRSSNKCSSDCGDLSNEIKQMNQKLDKIIAFLEIE